MASDLRGREAMPAALANADLLATIEADWVRRVIPRTSMNDLLFTLPDDPYPFRAEVWNWRAVTDRFAEAIMPPCC
jgi:hypothetical protein